MFVVLKNIYNRMDYCIFKQKECKIYAKNVLCYGDGHWVYCGDLIRKLDADFSTI